MSGTWVALRHDEPELAEAVRAAFTANVHHVLGTIRPDGSPRLSGTEVEVGADAVTIGMMPGSRKLADVHRDPRVEIHSAPLDEKLRHGDAKLRGRVRPNGPTTGPPGSSFVVEIELVSLVRVEGDELVLDVWRPGDGRRTIRRH